MVVLKKLRGSSLLENLVATVIVMVIFVIAGNAINQLVRSSNSNNSTNLDNAIRKTEYQILNGSINVPHVLIHRLDTIYFSKRDRYLLIRGKRSSDKTIEKCCLD